VEPADGRDAGRHRRVELRAARRREAGGRRRRGDGVLGEADHHGVRDARLRRARQLAAKHEEEHLAEVEVARQLIDVEAPDHDAIAVLPGDVAAPAERHAVGHGPR
jgi:hypothetical protein